MRPWRPVLVVGLFAAVAGIAAAEPAKLVGPFEKSEYPTALIDRPLTLPAGMIEAELGFGFTSQEIDPPIVGIAQTDEWVIDATLRAGVTDRIQVEVGTAFSLDYRQKSPLGFQGVPGGVDIRPSLASWKRVVPLRLAGLVLDTESLDTAVTLTLPFTSRAERTISIFRGGTLEFRNGDGRVLPAVDLAAPTRWRLNDWLWLRAGENLFSVTTGDVFATFAFDFGVGVQPHRIFAVTLDSRVAQVSFNGDGEDDSDTLGDRVPLDLEGTLAPCRWFDLVGSVGLPDAGHGFDSWATRMAMRVRF